MRNSLNDSDVNGNTQSWMASQDRNNAVSHEDQYECPCCQEIVEDHEFIHELKVCRQCFEDKHGSSYLSIDEAQAKFGGV